MKVQQIIFKEGATFSGISFWVGICFLVFAGYQLIHAVHLLAFIGWGGLLFLGVILMLALKGICIHPTQKKAFRYIDLLFLKFPYQHIALHTYTAVELRLYSDNTGMNMLSISTTVRTKEYEVYLKDDAKNNVLITASTDYAKALSAMHNLAEGLQLPAENEYEKWKARMKTRRRR